MRPQTNWKRWVALVVGALAVVLAAGGGVGAVAAQSATVDSCTVIDAPGTYQLGADITASDAEGPCIEITASDVTFDGNGNTLAGPTVTTTGTGIDGVAVDGTAADPLENVTVADLTTTGWSNGTAVADAVDSTVRGVTANDALMNGIRLAGVSDSRLTDTRIVDITEEERNLPGAGRGLTVTRGSANNDLTDVTFSNTKYSFLLSGGSQNNRIADVSATDTTYVVYLFSTDDNTIRNVTSVGNSRWPVYVERGSTGNTFTDTTLSGTTYDFQPTGVGIRPVPGPSLDTPPEPPTDRHIVGPAVEISSTQVDQSGSIDITMPYRPDAANASSASVWQFANATQDDAPGSWTEIGGDIDTDTATLRAEGATFAPLNDPGPSSGVFVPLAPGPGPATPTPTTTATPTPGATGTTTATATDATETATPTDAATTDSPAAPGAATPTEQSNATDTTETTTSTGFGPGFGPLVALGALLAAALLARRAA